MLAKGVVGFEQEELPQSPAHEHVPTAKVDSHPKVEPAGCALKEEGSLARTELVEGLRTPFASCMALVQRLQLHALPRPTVTLPAGFHNSPAFLQDDEHREDSGKIDRMVCEVENGKVFMTGVAEECTLAGNTLDLQSCNSGWKEDFLPKVLPMCASCTPDGGEQESCLHNSVHQECQLLLLDGTLLSTLWPTELIVTGRRVSQSVKRALSKGTGAALLKGRSRTGNLDFLPPSKTFLADFKNKQISLDLRACDNRQVTEIVCAFSEAGMNSALNSLTLGRLSKGGNFSPDCGRFTPDCFGIRSAMMNLLHKCTSLKHLDLRGSIFEDAREWEAHCSGTGTWGFGSALHRCTALVDLNLGGCHINDGGATNLAEVLGHCSCLEVLNVGGNRISRVGLAAIISSLRSCTRLRELNLSGNRLEQSSFFLGPVLTALESVSLGGGNKIGPRFVREIAPTLERCARLRHLNLSANSIGDEGVGELVGVLDDKNCSLLRTLFLGHNNLTSGRFLGQLHARGAGTPLIKLDLFGNWLPPLAFQELAGGLGACTALLHLELGGNQAGDEGATHIAEGLATCTTLTHLGLSQNGIEGAGVTAIAEKLHVSGGRSEERGGRSCIASLNLAENSIEVE
eukprot:CAMPEP_0181290278 /NCGR_PEP_ID=MMETSP1101-20121128/1329_1 /TAXON_ID=46948 /ORGANISM="Rhodomonas abbreviata, Strain Caron Lab Isolate" /LENGTH=627 /DNA_ID=CAMNT_0023394553 /DNA_START=27 /DNA_END=1907 /DNA_ORIENTATION=-